MSSFIHVEEMAFYRGIFVSVILYYKRTDTAGRMFFFSKKKIKKKPSLK